MSSASQPKMSAATVPSNTTGNAVSVGAGPERVSAKPRRRTTTASKVTSEATEAPLLASTHASALTRARRAREPRTGLEEVALAFLTRDANSLYDDLAAGVTHENNTPPLTPTTKKPPFVVGTASDKASPSKHKISKPAIPKGKVKKTSILATMGHLFSSKLFWFLLCLVGFFIIWNLQSKPALPEWYASSEVGKLEEFVTKTTKWMQVSHYSLCTLLCFCVFFKCWIQLLCSLFLHLLCCHAGWCLRLEKKTLS